MSGIACNPATLLDLPLEMLTIVCEQLDLRNLVRIAATCKRLRHGEGRRETVELPIKSPVVTALRKHASPGGELIPSTRSIGCSESWVAYLPRIARQRRCLEAPPCAAGWGRSLFVHSTGRLLTCGAGPIAQAHLDEGYYSICCDPTPVPEFSLLQPPPPAPGIGCGAWRSEVQDSMAATASPLAGMGGSTRGAATNRGSWDKKTRWTGLYHCR
jgi:hypothetical protein